MKIRTDISAKHVAKKRKALASFTEEIRLTYLLDQLLKLNTAYEAMYHANFYCFMVSKSL